MKTKEMAINAWVGLIKYLDSNTICEWCVCVCKSIIFIIYKSNPIFSTEYFILRSTCTELSLPGHRKRK